MRRTSGAALLAMMTLPVYGSQTALTWQDPRPALTTQSKNKVDLKVGAIRITQDGRPVEIVRVGTTVRIEYSIGVVGKGGRGECSVQVYLSRSPDRVMPTDLIHRRECNPSVPGSTPVRFEHEISRTTPVGQNVVIVAIDATGRIPETDEKNNLQMMALRVGGRSTAITRMSAGAIRVPNGPDLTVRGFAFADRQYLARQTVEVTFEVANTGDGRTAPSAYAISCGQRMNLTREIGADYYYECPTLATGDIPALAGGARAPIRTRVALPDWLALGSDQELVLVVDPDGGVVEVDEGNNRAVHPIRVDRTSQRPDLIVRRMEILDDAVLVTIANVGEVSAGGSFAVACERLGLVPMTESTVISDLAAGASVTWRARVLPTRPSQGVVYHYTATVDPYLFSLFPTVGVIIESDETNNSRSIR